MKRLLVVVEGQTEEIFVNRVLQPHLARFDMWATPTIVETRHLPGRPRDKGGMTSWDKARRDILRRLTDTAAFTTTLFDLYGLPDDFPGLSEPRASAPEVEANRLEAAMARAIDNPRFIPFLALHELEAWVFAAPDHVASHFGDPRLRVAVSHVVDQFPSIEHINHGPDTHPSRRLETMIVGYKKTSDGPSILEAAGLDLIRRGCPHLSGWVDRLERLST